MNLSNCKHKLLVVQLIITVVLRMKASFLIYYTQDVLTATTEKSNSWLLWLMKKIVLQRKWQAFLNWCN